MDLKLLLTKLACTVTSLFGYDLKARIGVQPNKERQEKAASALVEIIKELDPASVPGSLSDMVKRTIGEDSKAVLVLDFQKLNLHNPATDNKIVVAKFALPVLTGLADEELGPRVVTQKPNISESLRSTYKTTNFGREDYQILLGDTAQEGEDLLTSKELQARPEQKLEAFKNFPEAIAAHPESESIEQVLTSAEKSIQKRPHSTAYSSPKGQL